MYVRTYVCMYVAIYVCMCVCVYVCMCVCMHVCTCARVHKCTCVCVYVCMCVYTCTIYTFRMYVTMGVKREHGEVRDLYLIFICQNGEPECDDFGFLNIQTYKHTNVHIVFRAHNEVSKAHEPSCVNEEKALGLARTTIF